jgi:hypothetical protein
VIQRTFDDFGKKAGYTKRSGSWYKKGADAILVLNLQKSQYGPKYFVNVALWLLAVESAEYPKEHKCHVRIRLTQLLRGQEPNISRLLDLDQPFSDPNRANQLVEIFNDSLLPILEGSDTIEGLRSGRGRELVGKSLVTKDAQKILF